MSRMLLETHTHPTIPRLTLDRRADSPFYQARAFIDGRQRTSSTKTSDIRTAFRVAESWYKQQLLPTRARSIDRLGLDPIMSDVYQAYLNTLDDRRRAEAAQRWGPIKAFWETIRLIEIGPKTFRAFYAWRRRSSKGIKAHTLHKDVVLVRQVLKHAAAEEQLEHLPMVPSPGKIEPDPPPPLSDAEWEHLRKVSQQRIADAPNVRTKQQRTDCDHFMRLMIASCARVGEIRDDSGKKIRGLRFRDCRYRHSSKKDSKPDLLVCTVTGKRGTREIVAEADAVEVVSSRAVDVMSGVGKPGDLIFPHHFRDAFRELLIAANLRTDSKGRERNAKALRSTAICRALLAGHDVVFVAKNAGTSVDVISRYYTKYLTAEMAVRTSHPHEVPVSLGWE